VRVADPTIAVDVTCSVVVVGMRSGWGGVMVFVAVVSVVFGAGVGYVVTVGASSGVAVVVVGIMFAVAQYRCRWTTCRSPRPTSFGPIPPIPD
jgi:hypothetical protein